MLDIKQSETFRKWLSHLEDRRARTIVTARITRLAEGLTGDVKPIGGGLSELRIHYGPGYRVYFQQRGNVMVLLLCGGNKKSQSRDIDKAKRIAKQWSAQNG
jgi:putative addiction module killer protein